MFGYKDHRVKGYFCYQWAYAFKDAATAVNINESFTIWVKASRKGDSKFVHFWVEIINKKTGEIIFVDDGFTGCGMIHEKAPIQKGWQPDIGGAWIEDFPRSRSGKIPPVVIPAVAIEGVPKP